MSEPLKFRLGTKADDFALRALLRRNAMPGSISLSMRHEPSFFEAAEVEGNKTRVIVCEDPEQVVGMGVISEREVYVNGTPERVGYISRLRLDEAYRSSTGLIRGYRYFKTIQEKEFKLPYYLTTIMESNKHAVNTLTAGHADLPVYQKTGGYVTVVIPVLLKRKPPETGMQIIGGEEAGIENVIHCLNKFGSEKLFYPVYRKEDVTGGSGLLRGLSLSDFYVAVQGDKVTGVMACWDQRAFRPNVVDCYSGPIRYARKPLNFIAGLFNCRPLPDPGEVVPALHGACIAIRDNEPGVFRSLLQHILADVSERDASLFLMGFSRNDPLLQIATERIHAKIRSHIYTVSWNRAQPRADGSILYLELGSL